MTLAFVRCSLFLMLLLLLLLWLLLLLLLLLSLCCPLSIGDAVAVEATRTSRQLPLLVASRRPWRVICVLCPSKFVVENGNSSWTSRRVEYIGLDAVRCLLARFVD